MAELPGSSAPATDKWQRGFRHQYPDIKLVTPTKKTPKKNQCECSIEMGEMGKLTVMNYQSVCYHLISALIYNIYISLINIKRKKRLE